MQTEFSFSSVTCAERSVYYSAVFVFVFKKKKKSHTYERTYGRPRALRDVLEVGFI